MRKLFRRLFYFILAFYVLSFVFYPILLWSLVGTGPIIAIGLYDYFQRRHTILRNFPVLGHVRFIMEAIRPEIQQYFIEMNDSGAPISRENRNVVYQRAKKQLDTLPFGTRKNVYSAGYEWVHHSIKPALCPETEMRVMIGGPDCKQPYNASRLNVSAMSYGSLSPTAVKALGYGAKKGNFYLNTGEGGISPYHLESNCDIVWQIGTGYFGCRDEDGKFSAKLFEQKANNPQVKMIEIKLSQGAKPGHGGLLPAAKLTPEIAAIRGVKMGKDIVSPPQHTAFSTPRELILFIKQLRTLSNGKPVGFKLCVGKKHEFLAICKAMIDENVFPDFITVDGSEGGTGAAPLEFSNYVGAPLREGLILVHNCLVGFGIRNHLKIIASGKVMTSFDVISKICLGADICNSARAMMLAIGCIHALTCNTNKCPSGVATQDPDLYNGLDVRDKSVRVYSYHKETLKTAADLIGAMGFESPAKLKPWFLMRRVSEMEIKHYAQIYKFIEDKELLKGDPPVEYKEALLRANPDSFDEIAIYSKKEKKAS